MVEFVRKVHKDYVVTFAVSILSSLAVFLVYKLSRHSFGAEGFLQYSIGKRVISFLLPVLALGLFVGLPREVARVDGTENSLHKHLYLRYTVAVELILLIILTVLFSVFSRPLSMLFFSSTQYSNLMLPIALNIGGILFTEISYSYYRGLNQMTVSNAIFALNVFLIPVVLILCVVSMRQFFWLYGILMFATSFLFIIIPLFKRVSLKDNLLMHFFCFIGYSIRRVVGDVVFQLFFLFPSIFVAHTFTVSLAGNVSFVLSLMNLISIPLAPISTLLLPISVSKLKSGNIGEFKALSAKLVLYSILLGLGTSLAVFFAAPYITKFFLNDNEQALVFLRILAISFIPFAVYFVLRSLIDAASRRAYNSINLTISFIVFFGATMILVFFIHSVYLLACTLSLGFWVLGVLSYLRIRNIIQTNDGCR
jgi:O-antigen/teichoic acid export membrane protein